MCFWYSSSVVAPTTRSSPRASNGFNILAASMAPSDFPAPSTKWISSTNNTTPGGGAATTSPSTAFNRSSNSPLYLAPATSDAMSSVRSCVPRIPSGTSCSTKRSARPSATLVLPTPGGPTKHALFLVRLLKICTTLRTSSSRPITGSILPSSARFTKSRPYRSKASNWSSAPFVSTLRPPRKSSIAFCTFGKDFFRIGLTSFSSNRALSRWSCATSASPRFLASFDARSSSRARAFDGDAESGAGDWPGWRRTACSLSSVRKSVPLVSALRHKRCP
mmetsp:Transcript_7304/g.22496  ORF Transcript_7304/g.22496 Transcript_7304/m.22496 type:complete len:277 (+) Transcript_7304:1761-2591(+)